VNFISLNLEAPALEAKDIQTLSLDEFIRRIETVYETVSGITVTPETCMQSPTVHAIVTAASRKFASLPLHVFEKSTSNGRTTKEPLPDHPVEKLLRRPNDWQTQAEYWYDLVSCFLRYGHFGAFKSRGVTGPIRQLLPFPAGSIRLEQATDWRVTAKVTTKGGQPDTVTLDKIHYVRGPARDFLNGDSPIMDIRETIALEIAAEKFGSSFFGNGAFPGVVFQFAQGFAGFKTDEERKSFVEDFQRTMSGKGRFRAALPPKGVEIGKTFDIQNDKAQMVETRAYQRSVIAGALGFPPYIVGDLEHQTFNNAEQQKIVLNTEAILPLAKTFETAMERDLLTQDDRNSGKIIRFNLDGELRGDFKTRQDGLALQRDRGVINADEWREIEGYNPRADGKGDQYYDQGPSGQNAGGRQPTQGANSGTPKT
jgi:HK97 family phage portal protein